MDLRHLDDETRRYMLLEIEHDIAQDALWLSERLTVIGRAAYRQRLLDAATAGTADTLAAALAIRGHLKTAEISQRKGKRYQKRVPYNANVTLAEGEFGRFYARAICRRAIADGDPRVRVYRAKEVETPRAESEARIGTILDAARLLDDLRTSIGIDPALGVPSGPNSGLNVELLR